jgi:hypothetical protein
MCAPRSKNTMSNGHPRHTIIEPLPAGAIRAQRTSLIVGVVALVVCALSGLAWPRQFFQSYLIGFMLVLGVTLGSMAMLMLHHLTGGSWGVPIRRILEASSRNVPLVTILFLPLLAGIHHLYEWSHADIVAHDPILQEKQAYLNVPFFIVRAIIYFAAWNILSFIFNRGSAELDRNPSIAVARRLQLFSGPGNLIYVLTMTFASFDWMMSLEPHWYSTIYGLLTVVGQVLSALAVTIIILSKLAPRPPISEIVTEGNFQDLGNLTFAFVMLWAYMSLSQFLIIWAGNISEEVPWYVARMNNGWGGVALALVILQFAMPFVLLLNRPIKRNYRRIAKVAMLVVAMRVVDLFWWIAPAIAGADEHGHLANAAHRPFHVSYMDVLAPIGLGAIWVSAFIRQLGRRSLLPVAALESDDGHLAEGHA